MTNPAVLADLHPSIGRRVRRRRSVAYGCHGFIGMVVFLAFVANKVSADGVIFFTLDAVLSHPATLFLTVMAAIAGPAYTFSARWEAPLIVLGGLTLAVVGLLVVGPVVPDWAGDTLVASWMGLSLALPGLWLVRGRRRFSERAGIE